HHGVDLVVVHEGAVDPHRDTGTHRHVEHVAVPQQLLGATLVKDGAGIDLGGHLEGDAARHVGLDEAGDHIHRGPLGGENQVDTGGPCLLGDAGDELLNLLADDHHHVGEFVDHHHDIGQ